ncbi:MAG TPA: enolase C-terminal domain-like protein [Ktedonobacterales bacterium]|nr:enolase C-terminal domain-like protein [Ktedonobacterales bacterium]
MKPRTIERVDVFPTRLPVVKTFEFASGLAGTAGGTAPHVFVRVTDNAGEIGWGEGRPHPAWAYETLESVTTTIRGYLAPAVVGLPLTDRWGLHRRMHQAIGRGPSTGQPIAKAAVDMAVHDLCARASEMSLRSYLGGNDDRHAVALSYTVTAHDADAAAHEVRAARSAGYRHFNFKAAVAPATDIAVACAVRAAAGADAFVWADANQGFQLPEARRILGEFASAGVDVLEQPMSADRLHLLRALRQGSSLPLAVDEASVGPADFFAYAAEGLVDYLVVKVTRSGGIWPTLQQIATAEAAGLPLLVSGLTDGLLTKAAVCQVALVYGFGGPAALNGSQFIDESALYPDKARLEFDGVVHLGSAAGIGVAPDVAALREFGAG